MKSESTQHDDRFYLEWAVKELTDKFHELEVDGDTDGTYELNNLASGFNILLRLARKNLDTTDGLTLTEALAALMAGKKVRRKTWDPGQYAVLNSDGDIINHNDDYASLQPIQTPRSLICSEREAGAYYSELSLPLWELYEDPKEEGGAQE